MLLLALCFITVAEDLAEGDAEGIKIKEMSIQALGKLLSKQKRALG